jgi:N-acetylglucosamine-6-phosphate deacetylase
MNSFTLFAPRVFDGLNFHDNARVSVVDGKIASIDADVQANEGEITITGLLVPGFVDLQVNGGGGVLFNSSPSVTGIEAIMAAHAKFGTTAMLPTLITDTVEVMAKAADAIALAIKEKAYGIIGVHFEGPHLSVAKKGAHSEAFIRPISDQEWQVLSRQDLGKVLVTVAPENVSTDDISRMVSLGIKVCLGHTNADFATAQKAIDVGADGFTHLYNAMSPLTGREPGVVGCALVNDQASCGVIADGHHVDYVSLKAAIKAKPAGKVFLVTDAMPPVGTNDNVFDFFDRTVHLSDGKLTSTTGELAGSVLDMATAVKNTHQKLKLPLDESIRMASLYPASYIDASDVLGQLSAGSSADMVELDDNFSVMQTWVAGRQIYSA